MSSLKSNLSESTPISAPDLHDFLRTRRSIRRFATDPIPEDIVRRALETATHAPSAHNRQPWRFVIIKDSLVKSRLAEAMAADFQRDLSADGLSAQEIEARLGKSRRRITSAPLVIVLCLDASVMDTYPDPTRKKAEYLMAVQSVAAAGQQLLLALHAEGLGAVWTCGPLFAPQVVIKSLDLSATWEPQAMFFVGHPMESPTKKTIPPLEEVSLWR